MSVNQRFKSIRELLRLTQDEFGNSLDASRMMIGDIERGKSFPNPVILQNLFSKFNIDLNWLISGVGKMKHDVLSVVNDSQPSYGNLEMKDKYIKVLEENLRITHENNELRGELEKCKTEIAALKTKQPA